MTRPPEQKSLKKFEKTLDKPVFLWYNIDNERDKERVTKMVDLEILGDEWEEMQIVLAECED